MPTIISFNKNLCINKLYVQHCRKICRIKIYIYQKIKSILKGTFKKKYKYILVRPSTGVVGIMMVALGEIFLICYRSVVSQNEITKIFTILDEYQTTIPFSRVEMWLIIVLSSRWNNRNISSINNHPSILWNFASLCPVKFHHQNLFLS